MSLTIEAIVDAYKKHDLYPIEGEFLSEEQDLCCGLTAYAISRSESKEEFLEALSKNQLVDFQTVIFSRVMKDNPSLSHHQLESFIAGWDGQEVGDASADLRFYTLGNNAWRAVNEEVAK